MIANIISTLDTVAGNRLAAPARYGLAELVPEKGGTVPAVYAGNGSWTYITIDSKGNWAYWRLLKVGPQKTFDGNIACSNLLTRDHALRLVTLVDRSLCDGSIYDVASAAVSDMMAVTREVKGVTGASMVEILSSGVNVDTRQVFTQEFAGVTFGVQPSKALIAIDLVVRITGKEECFNVCGDPIDLTCALIEAATNAKVEECLGAERLAEICDTEGCTEMTITVTVNGVLEETIPDVNPCVDNTLNINITYS